MDRDRLFGLIDVSRAKGLEIGPLHQPWVSRDRGPIEYVDRASREELQRWYVPNDQVVLEDIVEIDHVWGDETLLECVGGRRDYDYVVASHVIEHVPDLFGWLGEIAAVLADGGLAFFAVPDKRYTFDVLRRTSSEAEFVDAYVRGLRRPDARQIFDHFYNFRDLGSPEIRNGQAPEQVAPTHSAREFLGLCRRAHEGGEYIDTHCWVFTPASLPAALDMASQLGLLPFEIVELEPTPPGQHEFLLVLRRLPEGMDDAGQRAAFVASRERLVLPDEAPDAGGRDLGGPDLGALTTAVNAATARYQALEASTSWKITAPLRSVVNLARRLRGRA